MRRFLISSWAFLRELSQPGIGERQFFAEVAKLQNKPTGADNEPIDVWVEHTRVPGFIIAHASILASLASQHRVRLRHFVPDTRFPRLMAPLIWAQQTIFGVNLWAQVFDCSGVIVPRLSRRQRGRAVLLRDQLLKSVKSRTELLNYSWEGVRVGDLIYDAFLRRYLTATIDLDKAKFKRLVSKAAKSFVYWENLLDSHPPDLIIGTHNVYLLGIPLRVGAKKGIRAFAAQLTSFARVDSKGNSGAEFFGHYRDQFSKLSSREQNQGIRWALTEIEQRKTGELVRGTSPAASQAFGRASVDTGLQIIDATNRPIVLIAMHRLSDSPHEHGTHLFDDFWDWLSFLAESAKTLDFEWLIKRHPDELPSNHKKIDSFLNLNPHLMEIPRHTTHKSLIENGLCAVLTVYGTVGLDYAALGVPVVNASVNNPHIAYPFNFHPRTIQEYRDLLERLGKLESGATQEDLAEFYFMHHGLYGWSIFLRDFDVDLRNANQDMDDFAKSHALYETWLRNREQNLSSLRLGQFYDFIFGDEIRMKSHSPLSRELQNL